MRWVQKFDPETGRSRFVEVSPRQPSAEAAIHGPIEAFVSPIDGTVISDRKQYREPCAKHHGVPAREFTPEYLAEIRRKRTERTRAETLSIKQELWERLHR